MCASQTNKTFYAPWKKEQWRHHAHFLYSRDLTREDFKFQDVTKLQNDLFAYAHKQQIGVTLSINYLEN